MQLVRRLMTVILALAVLMAIPSISQAQDGGQTTHTVQAGENLYRISLQYNVTMTALAQANNITNPNLIYVGQVLVIPGTVQQATATPTAPAVTAAPGATARPTLPAATATAPAVTATVVTTATPAPTVTPPPASGEEIVHVVQPGENLFRIALQYNLAPSIVAAYNGITNPNLIYVGQRIRIPPTTIPAQPTPTAPPNAPPAATAVPGVTGTPVVTAAVTTAPTLTPAPTNAPAATPAPTNAPAATPVPTSAAEANAIPNEASNVGFAYGAAIFLPDQQMNIVVGNAQDLGVTWVKQDIDWSLYEPVQGTINWEFIDPMIDAMDGAGLNILLTVTSAPGWARDTTQEMGPPADYQNYANFVGALADRYAGRVDAYEIWSNPNLRSTWNTPKGLSAASYVELLRLAYAAIKQADPAAVVVSGGLSPTGDNNGTDAIDDRVYLRQMYAAGVADWSDAIGAHPYGWGNPPDSVCCRTNRPAVSGWDDFPFFFFKETLQDYRKILVDNGDSGTYIWATEFGWGSNDGLGVQPPEGFGFVSFTSMDEQSQYTLRGFQIGRESNYVGPMFLWNMNDCQAVGVTNYACLWSMLDPAGNPRPLYLAVQAAEK